MPTSARVMTILERVAETDEVRQDPNIQLFDAAILDSLGLVQLIVALEEEFGVEISPAEIEREQWATPRKIRSYMESLVGV
jgi:D-alanine--poly(phosphoribitol) ligase subunit 2